MELPLQHMVEEYLPELDRCFNPCFNGTTSATKYGAYYGYMRRQVSILVLMELPLQLYRSSRYKENKLLFQSLF